MGPDFHRQGEHEMSRRSQQIPVEALNNHDQCDQATCEAGGSEDEAQRSHHRSAVTLRSYHITNQSVGMISTKG